MRCEDETALDILAKNIVNPRCDECGQSVRPVNPLLGPHLCSRCSAENKAWFDAHLRDYRSQERRRSIHIVKLPSELRQPACAGTGRREDDTERRK